MKILTGTDIIEIDRIKNSIENIGDRFIRQIYTEEEIKYCESKSKAKYQHYAARFAAKEAIFKAISKTLNDKFEISWKNAEVLNDKNGKPYVHFIDTNMQEKIEDIDISISHCKEYAIANVIVILK
jgi:holo-[acyl-carrier protein] synthase